MRIAIVTETFLPRVDGIVRMLLEFLAYLESEGHDAIVFAPGDGERVCHGFPVTRVHGLPFPLYPQLILAPYSTRMGPILRELAARRAASGRTIRAGQARSGRGTVT